MVKKKEMMIVDCASTSVGYRQFGAALLLRKSTTINRQSSINCAAVNAPHVEVICWTILNLVQPRGLASNHAFHRHRVGGDDPSIARGPVASNHLIHRRGVGGVIVGTETAPKFQRLTLGS